MSTFNSNFIYQFIGDPQDREFKLRLLDNDNLNKFIGVCVDGPLYFALWKCCMRGSVKVKI